MFIPRTYPWGQEEQVDWYEAWAEADGEPVKAYVFCLRSMASGGAFHRAYPSTPGSRSPWKRTSGMNRQRLLERGVRHKCPEPRQPNGE